MDNSKKNEPANEQVKRRNFLVMIGIISISVAVACKLVKLSVTENAKYAEMANETHFSNIIIPANRGTIYDASGNPLAWSATVYKIYIDPSLFREEMTEIEEVMKERKAVLDAGEELPEGKKYIPIDEMREEIITLLMEKLNLTREDVIEAMEDTSRYCVLQTQVDKNIADDIELYFEGFGINSIRREQDTKRYYPQDDLAAHVIGFTDSDGNGMYGIEAYYDDYLAGTNGRTISANDAFGREMPYKHAATYPAQDGDSLYLTLDSTLQYYLQKNLEDMYNSFQVANRCCGIMMNPKTGAIYAMATYPSYDLNNPAAISDPYVEEYLKSLPKNEYEQAYIEAREAQWKNKAVTELYTPGSVFKIFTTAAAVEEGVLNPDTDGFNCTGEITVAGALKPIGCHLRTGHGYQTFSEALTHSCNPAFIQIGLSLGVERFSHYFDAFGLSTRTGIDLPGEAFPIYYESDAMSLVDLASSSFGQATKLTPIEMITSISAAINGGYLVKPYVVSKVVSSEGNVVYTNKTYVKRQVISEETSAKVCELLQEVVEENGGSNAYIKGYAIGGKSGTSEKLDEYDASYIMNSEEEVDKYVASYACFAPANDPEIVLLMLADEPHGESYYGSKVVVPYASEMMEQSLPYLGFYPEYSEEEYAQMDVIIPLLIDKDIQTAKQTLESLGLNYDIRGEGSTVIKQCPVTNSQITKGGTVILYAEKGYEAETVEVPDLKKYTASDAKDQLAMLGLNYVMTGASSDREGALVGAQSVAPGTKVEVGTVIRLTIEVEQADG